MTAPRNADYSDEELALLTEEEREAMLAEDDGDDNEDDTGDTAAAESATTDAGGGDEGAPVKSNPIAPDATAGDEETSPEPKPEPGRDGAVEENETAPPPVAAAHAALPDFQRPANFDDQLAALRAQKADLADKFDAGEISAKELHAGQDQIDDKMFNLREANLKADLAYAARVQTWSTQTVPAFMRAHPEYQSDTLYKMLDTRVRELQQAAGLDGSDNLSPAILDQAHSDISRDMAAAGFRRPAPEPATVPRQAAPAQDLPPNIGNLPAAGVEEVDVNGGLFAHLDRLSGEEHEKAFAKLSPAQQAAYLAG